MNNKKKIYKVLVTGSIGSGKSTVCKMFEKLGVSVYYSDKQTAGIMNKDKVLINKIKETFGEYLYEDGLLNRKALAEVVFNDNEKLNMLNKLVHPIVSAHFDKWFKMEEFLLSHETNSDEDKVNYIIEESAIAIELGIKNKFDYIIVVTANEDVRIERVMARDNCDRDAVIARMNNQMSNSDKCNHADFLIINDGNSNLELKVKSVHENIKEKIKSSCMKL